MERALNGPKVQEAPDIKAGEDLEANMSPITIEEIQRAISKIKSGKAPGADNIPPEALKADSKAAAEVMHMLLKQIWEEKRIPDEWRSGIIVKLPKKGDLSDCNN